MIFAIWSYLFVIFALIPWIWQPFGHFNRFVFNRKTHFIWWNGQWPFHCNCQKLFSSIQLSTVWRTGEFNRNNKFLNILTILCDEYHLHTMQSEICPWIHAKICDGDSSLEHCCKRWQNEVGAHRLRQSGTLIFSETFGFVHCVKRPFLQPFSVFFSIADFMLRPMVWPRMRNY